MTKRTSIVPRNAELTQAIVRAHAPGKNRRPLSADELEALPPVKRVFYTPNEKQKRMMKARVTLPVIKI